MNNSNAQHIVYIGLGTNLGNRKKNLAAARNALSPQVILLEASPIYETKPWGYSNQPDFLNQVVKTQTKLNPLDLLAYLKQCEVSLGRIPSFKYGPRLVDMDILFFDDLILETPALTIPHPEIPKRAFVLAPLTDIAPDMIHPILGRSIRQLLKKVDMDEVKKISP